MTLYNVPECIGFRLVMVLGKNGVLVLHSILRSTHKSMLKWQISL